jgi:hypothetical protein
MNKYLIALLIVCLASPIYAASIQTGLYETQVGFSYDISDVDESDFLTGIGGLGYYLTDNLQAGGLITFGKTPNDSYWKPNDVWGLGPFAEYNFNISKKLVPFASASLIFLSADNAEANTFNISAGVKYFFCDSIALTAQLNAHFADEEIYDFEWTNYGADIGEGEKRDFSIGAGLRFLL